LPGAGFKDAVHQEVVGVAVGGSQRVFEIREQHDADRNVTGPDSVNEFIQFTGGPAGVGASGIGEAPEHAVPISIGESHDGLQLFPFRADEEIESGMPVQPFPQVDGGDQRVGPGPIVLIPALHVVDEPLEQNVVRFDLKSVVQEFDLVNRFGSRFSEIEHLETALPMVKAPFEKFGEASSFGDALAVSQGVSDDRDSKHSSLLVSR